MDHLKRVDFGSLNYGVIKEGKVYNIFFLQKRHSA